MRGDSLVRSAVRCYVCAYAPRPGIAAQALNSPENRQAAFPVLLEPVCPAIRFAAMNRDVQ